MARMQQDSEVMAYRFYISDGIKALTGNTSGGDTCSLLTQRYYEILNPVKETKEDAQKIINRIVAKLGGAV